jgi:polysaccharide export outer membrane protein
MTSIPDLFRALVPATLLLLAGCASYSNLPAGTRLEVTGASPVVAREAVSVPSLEAQEIPSPEYRLGPGDILYVNVNGRPEMGSPVMSSSGTILGSRIDGAGNLHLPLVGSVAAAGLTVGKLQTKLQELYRRYLTEPWVVVEVADFRSQPVYLLGQFRTGGTYYLDRPMTLLQGLALGGGLTDAANLKSARLVRDGRTQPLDIRELIEQGGVRQNVWLQPGDTIFVPDDRNQNVFVFGAVSKPGPVPMPNGSLNLPQALAAAGAGEISGQTDQVRIIRSLSATRGELMVVDMTRIMEGDALPFPLVEGDIVYLPRSAVGNWNQAIGEILPSLQAVSALLQPFVQIHLLTRD